MRGYNSSPLYPLDMITIYITEGFIIVGFLSFKRVLFRKCSLFLCRKIDGRMEKFFEKTGRKKATIIAFLRNGMIVFLYRGFLSNAEKRRK